MYRGDVRLGQTVDFKFTTVNTAGVPTTLAGTPVISAYVDDSDTELTAGITLTVDKDGRTGLNHVHGVLSGANGYASGTNIQFVITTGTVSGGSVVGYVVAEYSIQHRSIVVDADGAATSNLSKILGTLLTETAGLLAGGFKKFFNVATPTGTVNSLPDAVPGAAGGLARTDDVPTVQAIVDGVWDESLTAHQDAGSTGAALADSSGDTAPTVQQIVDGVWDESLTAHQGVGSTGAALADASGDTSDVNVIQIGGLTEPVTKLVRSARTIVLGTVDAGASVTVIPTSALDPAAAIIGQFNGRVVIFDETTATATLRGCAATIESSAADGTLTLLTAEQLTAAPASGDTFVIV